MQCADDARELLLPRHREGGQAQLLHREPRDAPNPHDRLAPHQSARIIINHVLDGQALAKQYKLPKPIVDGIMMHHGTGIIQYFYAKAVEEAGEGMVVDPDDFRYPGELPSTREAGIIFLADRVEAACRTLKDQPREHPRHDREARQRRSDRQPAGELPDHHQ